MLDNVWTEVSTEPDNSVTRRQPRLVVGVDLRRYTAFCGDPLDFRIARTFSTVQAEGMDTDNMSPPVVQSVETTAVDEVAEEVVVATVEVLVTHAEEEREVQVVEAAVRALQGPG